MKCEYLITATDGENKKNRQDTINAWGVQGWRVVEVIPSKNGSWILQEKESSE
jgi:hypothetical protein